MFSALGCLRREQAPVLRAMLGCFGLAGLCLASPYYARSATRWLNEGVEQLLELRRAGA